MQEKKPKKIIIAEKVGEQFKLCYDENIRVDREPSEKIEIYKPFMLKELEEDLRRCAKSR